jgi:hypothetical protein
MTAIMANARQQVYGDDVVPDNVVFSNPTSEMGNSHSQRIPPTVSARLHNKAQNPLELECDDVAKYSSSENLGHNEAHYLDNVRELKINELEKLDMEIKKRHLEILDMKIKKRQFELLELLRLTSETDEQLSSVRKQLEDERLKIQHMSVKNESQQVIEFRSQSQTSSGPQTMKNTTSHDVQRLQQPQQQMMNIQSDDISVCSISTISTKGSSVEQKRIRQQPVTNHTMSDMVLYPTRPNKDDHPHNALRFSTKAEKQGQINLLEKELRGLRNISVRSEKQGIDINKRIKAIELTLKQICAVPDPAY